MCTAATCLFLQQPSLSVHTDNKALRGVPSVSIDVVRDASCTISVDTSVTISYFEYGGHTIILQEVYIMPDTPVQLQQHCCSIQLNFRTSGKSFAPPPCLPEPCCCSLFVCVAVPPKDTESKTLVARAALAQLLLLLLLFAAADSLNVKTTPTFTTEHLPLSGVLVQPVTPA